MTDEFTVVPVSKALLIKNRMTAELAELKRRFQVSNKLKKGDPKPYDAAACWARILDLSDKLVRLKTAISEAASVIAGPLKQVEEARSLLAWLNSLDGTPGVIVDTTTSLVEGRWTETEVKTPIEVAIEQSVIDNRKIRVTAAIDAAQEQIDRHNYTAVIRIPSSLVA